MSDKLESLLMLLNARNRQYEQLILEIENAKRDADNNLLDVKLLEIDKLRVTIKQLKNEIDSLDNQNQTKIEENYNLVSDWSNSHNTEDEIRKTEMIFISYSSKDWNKFAYPLVKKLQEKGFIVWVDKNHLKGGQVWLDKLNEALETCFCMIICVTPSSLSSEWVKVEYRYFLDENKPIIPVICRNAKIPAELRGLQNVHFRDFKHIIEAINQVLPKNRRVQ